MQSGASAGVAPRERIGPDVGPRAGAQQTQRRRRREDVVIELEAREGEKPDDRRRPGPQQNLERVEPLALDRRTNVVHQTTDDEAGPGQESRGENLKIKPDARLIPKTVRRVEPQVLVEEGSIYDILADAQEHVDEPRRRQGDHEAESEKLAQTEQPAASVGRRDRREQ